MVTQMSMADYRAAEGVSKSDLDLIHRSPAHYREHLLNPEPPTPAMVWGAMFHDLVLQPDVFDATYAVLPEGIDRRTKEGKQIWEDWQTEFEGKTPVDRPTLTELTAMRDALFANERAKNALTGGVPEQSLFWENGITCKARPDYTKPGLLVDLKSCLDARPEPFSKACWNYRYHVQAGWYGLGHQQSTGDKCEFLFIAIEKTPPYAVALYLADDSMVRQGLAEALADAQVYAECVETDNWPGYPDEIQTIMLPTWAQEERP